MTLGLYLYCSQFFAMLIHVRVPVYVCVCVRVYVCVCVCVCTAYKNETYRIVNSFARKESR